MSAREETIERLREQAEEEALTIEDAEIVDPETPEEPKRAAIREYIVFEHQQPGIWREVGRVNAGTAGSAIKSIDEAIKQGIEYAACPSRNWSVGSPEVETTTSIKIKFQ